MNLLTGCRIPTVNELLRTVLRGRREPNFSVADHWRRMSNPLDLCLPRNIQVASLVPSRQQVGGVFLISDAILSRSGFAGPGQFRTGKFR